MLATLIAAGLLDAGETEAPGTGEPVSLALAKKHLRVDGDDEDDLIAQQVTAAREWVERYTGLVLVQREFVESRMAFGSYIELRKRPVVSIEAITYIDAGGDLVEIEPGAWRWHETMPARIYPPAGLSWPQASGEPESVGVRIVAGYEEGLVPASLCSAILLLAGHLYKNRESVATGTTAVEVPLSVYSLCDQYRLPVL